MDEEPKRQPKNLQVDKDVKDLFVKSPLGPIVLGKMIDDVNFLGIATDMGTQRAQDEIKIILTKAGIGVGMKGVDYVRRLAGIGGNKALISNEEQDGD
jgi:hypothetical protein